MIIVDFSQVTYSTLMTQLGFDTSKITEVNEDMLRHMILNCLRSYNTKYKDKYGEMVIACDSSSWRKEYFPYYKANRKKARDQSEYDWESLYKIVNKIRDEVKAFLPYRVIHIEKAEADDIIAALVIQYSKYENILILSGDKDFVQLHNSNIKQYDPTRKKEVSHPRPDIYLIEHIIKGDSGDGIPNILSPDNCLVVGQRQKPITNKRLESLKNDPIQDTSILRNFTRNRNLIDLSLTPQEIKDKILQEYIDQQGKNRSMMLSYFMNNKLKILTEHISDF